MKAYVRGLGLVFIDRLFLCGAYKYGYVNNTILVRYDYHLCEWSVACTMSHFV